MSTEANVRKTHVPRRSGVVIPQRLKWHGEIAAGAVWFSLRALSATWRMEIQDETARAELRSGPIITAIWHNRLAITMRIWQHWQRVIPGIRVAALISASRDGALLARVLSDFGVTPIRGSSSRRGAQALLELALAVRSGSTAAITPDGPRGPKYQVQSGIISLAQVTGAPIIPIGAHIHWKKELRSWDHFQVPLPFSRCLVVMGEPIRVARRATEGEREAARTRLEESMHLLNRD